MTHPWNLDSGIGIEPTWNRNRRHNFMLESESELESNYSQWNRNWNRMCRNRPITDIYYVVNGLLNYETYQVATLVSKHHEILIIVHWTRHCSHHILQKPKMETKNKNIKAVGGSQQKCAWGYQKRWSKVPKLNFHTRKNINKSFHTVIFSNNFFYPKLPKTCIYVP